MNKDDFEYKLPAEFIAQRPAKPRDSSRLLVLPRESGPIDHRIFRDLPEYLRPEDVLVVNESRVIPARLTAKKVPSGGKAEILLIRRKRSRRWEAIVGGRRLEPGQRLAFNEGVHALILENLGGARRLLVFDASVSDLLDRLGEMPLPPYIRTPLRDDSEYQTVYARSPGSAAAPTAGLHFTPELLRTIEAKGTEILHITLHVGLDTFAPVEESDPRKHLIHSEWIEVSQTAAQRIETARSSGGRVVAVGTTTVRALESACRRSKGETEVHAYEGPTDLFILPGYEFKIVDGIVTNFHLPKSTLIMMISAFVGRTRLLEAYEIAKREGYRFYSFGDAMLIL